MEIYQSLLQTTENTRDLGGLVGADHTVTRYWSVLRSDVPLDPSASDVDLLRSHHITTIIDMRDEPAIRQKPNGFVGREGFRVVSCPIVEGSEIPDSVAEVPHGYLRIAGSNGMGQALQVIADLPEDEGVLFHCTAGKDRSGVLSVILLLLAGVSVRDVVTDYLLTGEYIRGRLAKLRSQYPTLDMEIVTPRVQHISSFLTLFDEQYGNVLNYLRCMKLTEEQIRRLRCRLIPARFPTHIVSVRDVTAGEEGVRIIGEGSGESITLPGRLVENGEDLTRTLQREIRESAGIEIRVARLLCVCSGQDT